MTVAALVSVGPASASNLTVPTCKQAPRVCPVITSTQASFTVPVGPAASWKLTLYNVTKHDIELGSTTTVVAGELTLAVPAAAGCTFQADVDTGAVGVANPKTYYSGIVTSFTTCGVPPSCQLSITSNFNSTAIPGGYIWLNSAFRIGRAEPSGATVKLTDATVQFTAAGTSYSVKVPDAIITFSPSASSAKTKFVGGKWITQVPAGFQNNVFLSGLPWAVPAGGLPGGITGVTWSGDITLSGVSGFMWEWAAAVYPKIAHTPIGYNNLGVKPVLSSTEDSYGNWDQAGTPENFKANVTPGATGEAGSNATGSYTGSRSCCG